MLRTLVEYGLIDRRRAAGSKTLAEHLADYRAALLDAGNTTEHAEQAAGRLERMFGSAGFDYWSDIAPSRVQVAIASLRRHKRPLKSRTRNHYLATIKAFCNWMVQDGRASQSPLTVLSRQAVTDATEAPSLYHERTEAAPGGCRKRP